MRIDPGIDEIDRLPEFEDFERRGRTERTGVPPGIDAPTITSFFASNPWARTAFSCSDSTATTRAAARGTKWARARALAFSKTRVAPSRKTTDIPGKRQTRSAPELSVVVTR